ncbi:hypothetical protein JCM3766R1_005659, partial [Sporobolomyces carnicolor]
MSKRPRIDRPRDTEPTRSTTTQDVVALVESSSSSRAAFSPVANLVAIASSSPSRDSNVIVPSSSSTSATHPPPPSISLTYLAPRPRRRSTFRLELPSPASPSPPTPTTTRAIKLLSFSPDGSYLLSVSGSRDADNDDGTDDDYLTVFEQSESGQIDRWNVVLHEQAATWGARGGRGRDTSSSTTKTTKTTTTNSEGNEVVSVRWVGEPRAWFANPDYSQRDGGDRPFSCAPPRSSPLSGAAFVCVLSSDEIVFVHLPRQSPLLPNIVCMPLHPPPSALVDPTTSSSSSTSTSNSDSNVTAVSPSRRTLSLTAVPTPRTSFSVTTATSVPVKDGITIVESTMTGGGTTNDGRPPTTNVAPLSSTTTTTTKTTTSAAEDQPTPTSRISQLVGSLVSNLAQLDASSLAPLAMIQPTSPAQGAGQEALKEELRAAELATSMMMTIDASHGHDGGGGDTEGGGGASRSAQLRGRRRIRLCDVGTVRGSRESMEEGLTTFVIASVSKRLTTKPRPRRGHDRNKENESGGSRTEGGAVRRDEGHHADASSSVKTEPVTQQQQEEERPQQGQVVIDAGPEFGAMNLDEDNFDFAAIDGFDFTSLDAAFGTSSSSSSTALIEQAPTTTTIKTVKTEPSTTTGAAADDSSSPGGRKTKKDLHDEDDEVSEWNEWDRGTSRSNDEDPDNNHDDGSDAWRIDLCEVKIDMLNVDGPRLTVKPQPHMFASLPCFPAHETDDDDDQVEGDMRGRSSVITHLAFLENNDLACPSSSSSSAAAAGDESTSAADLQLLVVSTSCVNSFLRTSLSTYDLSKECYALSEAFSHLECRKSDNVDSVDLGEWAAKFRCERRIDGEGVVTGLSPRGTIGVAGTFTAIVAAPRPGESDDKGESAWASNVVVLNSKDLEPHGPASNIALPDSNLYSTVVLSPNAAVVVCLPSDLSRAASQPVVAALPVAKDNAALLLALSLIRQTDATDVSGVSTSRKDGHEDPTELLDSTHALVQAQMTSDRPVCDSSIQLDLLGVAASMFSSAAVASATDPTCAARAKTARDFVGLAAAVRAFDKAEKKRRRGPSGLSEPYRCET